jgi:hypothetical protein
MITKEFEGTNWEELAAKSQVQDVQLWYSANQMSITIDDDNDCDDVEDEGGGGGDDEIDNGGDDNASKMISSYIPIKLSLYLNRQDDWEDDDVNDHFTDQLREQIKNFSSSS